MKKYYLLPFANFLAAIGGGIILTAGIGKLEGTFLAGSQGSILAFFAGAVIGLLLHRVTPERWSRFMARWFALIVGVASLILYGLFRAYAVGGKLTGIVGIIFIALLSVRFGLWFFSRALRAQIVGSEKQGIALIELGYYTGMALGLLIWNELGYDMLSALLVDAMMQTAAGLIDLLTIGNREQLKDVSNEFQEVEQEQSLAGSIEGNQTDAKPAFDYRWYWRLAVAVVCLTIGFQAVPFSVTHRVTDESKIHILACFYAGVALAALVCKVFKIKFGWGAINSRLTGNATISSEIIAIKQKPSFGLITLMAATCLVVALLSIKFSDRATRTVLVFIVLSAFIYQILVLSLLDKIGRAEKVANLKEMIMQTYLITAVATIISIWILGFFSESYLGRVLLTLVCSVISFSSIRKRVDVYA